MVDAPSNWVKKATHVYNTKEDMGYIKESD